MRVFVTGASGHIGSAVVPELVSAGHEVVGLARSETSATALKALGAEVRLGDLDDLDGLREAAAEAEGVIHLAFKHEVMWAGDYARAIGDDLTVVRAFGEALAGTGKVFVGTSGIGAAGPGGTEADVLPGAPRVEAEEVVLGFAERGVRSSVVRLPPVVHSELDRGGFVPTLIAAARRTGVAGYLGDGANRWPAAHTLDVARLYRLAVERAPAGTRLHALGEDGVPFRAIADAIGRHLALPVEPVPADRASDQFGFLAAFVGADIPASGGRTRDLLSWSPTGPGLIADLDLGHYFTGD